ncbi:hypothetical protein D3C78_1747930 [compost metagenome]
MGEDQAGQARDADGVFRRLFLHIGDTEQQQRHAFFGVPVAFHGGHLGRLVLEGVEAVSVTD